MNVKVTSYAFSKGNVVLYPIQVNFFHGDLPQLQIIQNRLECISLWGYRTSNDTLLADTFKDSALTLQALNKFQPQRWLKEKWLIFFFISRNGKCGRYKMGPVFFRGKCSSNTGLASKQNCMKLMNIALDKYSIGCVYCV